MPAEAPSLLPVAGRRFDDLLDGYFPLGESIGQMMTRQGFAAALLRLTQAPMLHLPDLGPEAPVPLRIPPDHAGLIQDMQLFATLRDGRAELRGTAVWHWQRTGPTDHLPRDIRLAEPAFVRGIGLLPGPARFAGIDGLRPDGAAARFALVTAAPGDGARRPGWTQVHATRIGARAGLILPPDAPAGDGPVTLLSRDGAGPVAPARPPEER